MPGAGAIDTGTAGPFDTGRPDTSAAAQAARAAALEAARSGDQIAVQEAMATLVAIGDLKPAADYDDFESDDGEDSQEESPEIDFKDEESPHMEDWDRESGERPTASLQADGSGREEQEGIEKSRPWRLIVEDGTCRFERAEWWKNNGANKLGWDWLNDTERRFLLFEEIAEWLTEERREFLLDPNPWHLGCNAVGELREGWASVSQSDFVSNTGLDKLAGPSLFSRNNKEIVLVFADGELPVDFLFGPDARMAWVANAVKGMATETGRKMVDVLTTYKGATVPRGEKKRLQQTSLDDLDFGGIIARACAIAGENQPIKWSGVIKRFKNEMLA